MTRLRAFVILCALSGYIHAQVPVRYNFRHVSPKNGLSSIYARKIIQDPYGFLWIGTQDGLNRYDGKNFVVYNTGLGASRLITGPDIRDLLVDTANHLIWTVNSYGGIDAIDYKTGLPMYHYFQTADRNTAEAVFLSLALNKDQLYIGSADGVLVLNTRERKLRPMVLNTSLTSAGNGLFIDKILVDPGGNTWVFCRNTGVLLLHKGSVQGPIGLPLHEFAPGDGATIRFYDAISLHDGGILCTTSLGLRLFRTTASGSIYTDNNPFPDISGVQGRDIYACRQDAAGDIWFCSPGLVLRKTPGRKGYSNIIESTSRDEYGWLTSAYTVFFDRGNNVWLGCQQGVAFSQNYPTAFSSMHRSAVGDVTIRHAYYIYPVNDTLVYCCAQDGLYEAHPNTGMIRQMDGKHPFYHAMHDPFGRLIVSSIEGVFFLSGRSLIPLEKVYPEFRPLQKIIINSHCYVGDSVMVLGTENDRGIVIWNYKRRKAAFVDTGTPHLWLKENTVNTVHKDSTGRVWVLGDASVSILDFSTNSTHTLNIFSSSQGKFYSIFFDVCQIGETFYLASYGAGVLVVDKNLHIVRELSTRDGLAGNSVYKILPWKDSLLFVTSNNGLSEVSLRHNYSVKNYYESHGLHSDNFEENSGAILNNKLYAGGPDGFSIADLSRLPLHPENHHIYLRQVRIATASGTIDTSNLLLNLLKIPNNVQQTTVYFSALNYSNPERTLFYYKIKELNGNWVSIGAQDYVTLIGLNPGKYTLQARSENEDALPGDRQLEISLTFLPKWYQTIWFKVLVLLVVSVLVYTFFLYRIGQYKKQQQIRKDIASDLHDDIGSILNSVKIFTHLAQKNQENQRYLASIEESLGQATMGLRDMIWVLDDSGDTIGEWSERIRKFAIPVTTANNIQFECIIGDGLTDHILTKPQKRNLLLITKETINNSIKYAKCRSIRVTALGESGKLSFCICDDGIGFDTSNPQLGNGLKNIAQRASHINCEYQIVSSPGNGTRVLVYLIK